MKVIKALYSLLPASSAKVTPRDTDTHTIAIPSFPPPLHPF